MHPLRLLVVMATLLAGALLPHAAHAASIEVLKCGSAELSATTRAQVGADPEVTHSADAGTFPCGSTATATPAPADASGTCAGHPCSAHASASVTAGASATVDGGRASFAV
jgi:hypothetical protein